MLMNVGHVECTSLLSEATGWSGHLPCRVRFFVQWRSDFGQAARVVIPICNRCFDDRPAVVNYGNSFSAYDGGFGTVDHFADHDYKHDCTACCFGFD